jgi:hypothetical protein
LSGRISVLRFFMTLYSPSKHIYRRKCKSAGSISNILSPHHFQSSSHFLFVVYDLSSCYCVCIIHLHFHQWVILWQNLLGYSRTSHRCCCCLSVFSILAVFCSYYFTWFVPLALGFPCGLLLCLKFSVFKVTGTCNIWKWWNTSSYSSSLSDYIYYCALLKHKNNMVMAIFIIFKRYRMKSAKIHALDLSCLSIQLTAYFNSRTTKWIFMKFYIAFYLYFYVNFY